MSASMTCLRARFAAALAPLLLAVSFPSLLHSAPHIKKITPRVAEPGDVITIDGSGFSADPADNIVRVGNNYWHWRVMSILDAEWKP